MATVIHLPKDPNNIGANLGRGIVEGVQQQQAEQARQARIQAIQSAFSDASKSSNIQEARDKLSPFIEDGDDMVTVENVLNSMFPKSVEDELIDAINVNTGGLVRTTRSRLDDSLRPAPTGTKIQRLFKDQPDLELIASFASGSKAAKDSGGLTLEEHKAKFSNSAGGNIDKGAAQARARIRANNIANPDKVRLSTSDQATLDAAILLNENDSDIIKMIDQNFNKAFGFDVTFAEEDLPIRNRAQSIAENLVIRERMPISNAAEQAVKLALDEISEERVQRIRDLNQKNSDDKSISDDKNITEPGVVDRILNKLTSSESQDNSDSRFKDPDAVQLSVPYTTPDGTSLTINIPNSIDLSADDAATTLHQYLVKNKGLSPAEALDFIKFLNSSIEDIQ